MKLDVEKQAEIKRILGFEAAKLVQDGMLVGLGTGSTANCFIESLIDRCKKGLRIRIVSSSERSMEMARKGGIPVSDMSEVTSIDLVVDGADEVDPQNRLIKGKGGALVREKILASTAKKMVVIVDESKVVTKLGACGLPIEILQFGYRATIDKIEKKGYGGFLRKTSSGSPYITDNDNYIYDIDTPQFFNIPEDDHQKLVNIPGVVDTGFFFQLASDILVGYADGTTRFRVKI